MVKTAEDRVREMLKTGEGWTDFEKKLEGIETKCVVLPLAEDKEPEVILNTGTKFDELFGGGLTAGQTVEMFGEYASGKTQTIFTLVVEAASEGIVIYVDAEDTFSRKRIIGIAKARGKDVEIVNRNIWLYKPERWEQQLAIPANLPDLPDKIKLIVVDSLMALFRETPEFAGRSNLGKRQELIRWNLKQWKKIAKKNNAVVIYTNQVYDEPNARVGQPKWASQRPVGGHSVAHIGNYRIFIRKGPLNVRIARLIDNSEIAPAERIFQINERGIDDLSAEQMKEALKRTAEWEETQQKGELVRKRKNSYYCTECGRNHAATSKIGKQHLEYKKEETEETPKTEEELEEETKTEEVMEKDERE